MTQVCEKVEFSRPQEIREGVRLSLAAGLGIFPIGVAFGLLVVQSGLPWWVAPAMSIVGFSGSLELLLIGMMAVATPLAPIALTTFLVNFRHVFYAFSFPLRVVRNPLARFYSVFALVDEAYAVTSARPDGWTSWRLVSMQLSFHSYWVGGGLVGLTVAGLLPGPVVGLEFALCALFLTLTLDACRTGKQVPSLLMAAASFAFATVLTPDTVMFTGLVLFVAALIVRYVAMQRRREHV